MIDLNNYLEFKITTALESGSRTINPEENCPPNPKTNPKPNPNPEPNRGGFSLGAIVRIPQNPNFFENC